MAGRSRSTFGKRLKEMKRQEKRQDKAARKEQRKREKLSGPSSGDADEQDPLQDVADPDEDDTM